MFNLTREERLVILFLLAVAFAGAGINFLVKKYSPLKTLAGFSQDLGKINLNSADEEMLMAVPGIGEKLAKRIIEYRQREAGFGDLEELLKIKGISESKFEKIKNYLIIK